MTQDKAIALLQIQAVCKWRTGNACTRKYKPRGQFRGLCRLDGAISGSGKSTLLYLVSGIDAPTGNLDKKASDEALNLFDYLNRELQKTVIMVTHDPHAAERAKITLHLDKGVLLNGHLS